MGIPSSLLRNEAGCQVSRGLEAATTTMGGREFLGRWYDAHALRSAVRIQIGREKDNLNLVGRHDYVMQVLDLYYSEPTWRKQGHRWALLELLAEHIVSTNHQTAK